MAAEAFINPTVLRWARLRDRVSPEDAARRIGVNPERIQAWEEGRERPTLLQAQSLAERYSLPFGYLYLSEPPSDDLALPDLRTVGSGGTRRPSPSLRTLLADVLAKHEWYREYKRQSGSPTLPFIGIFRTDTNPAIVADDIARRLSIDPDLRGKVSTRAGYLAELIRRVERSGILILRSGIVGNNTNRPLDVKEFRGFAISDPYAPLIFINARDAAAAQIFTLAHELAHLWFGESGISNPNLRSGALVTASGSAEGRCNRVAADLLMPKSAFEDEWDDELSIRENLAVLSRSFWVSELVILRHAYDMGLLTRADYSDYYAKMSTRLRATGGRSGGGDFYRNLRVRNGAPFLTALVNALSAGEVLHVSAARLLGVGVGRLEEVVEHVQA